jgi:hypothetical protein
MLGLSLYPHHLKDNTNCTLESFCEMTAKTAEIMGIEKYWNRFRSLFKSTRYCC